MPKREAIRALVPWSEWPASTDSQKEAEEREEGERADILIDDRAGDDRERYRSPS